MTQTEKIIESLREAKASMEQRKDLPETLKNHLSSHYDEAIKLMQEVAKGARINDQG